jgi:hypothetical protein
VEAALVAAKPTTDEPTLVQDANGNSPVPVAPPPRAVVTGPSTTKDAIPGFQRYTLREDWELEFQPVPGPLFLDAAALAAAVGPDPLFVVGYPFAGRWGSGSRWDAQTSRGFVAKWAPLGPLFFSDAELLRQAAEATMAPAPVTPPEISNSTSVWLSGTRRADPLEIRKNPKNVKGELEVGLRVRSPFDWPRNLGRFYNPCDARHSNHDT